jgi:2',3'-cyclic-nucleotide 2'-phosphodiesterase
MGGARLARCPERVPRPVRVLLVGDVIGSPGRRALASALPAIRAKRGVDLTIANGENSAGGRGLTRQTVEDMLAAGVDVITTGNHVWVHREIEAYLEQDVPVIRPLNFPIGTPGRGAMTLTVGGVPVRVVNLMGTVNMDSLDNPFRTIDQFLYDAPRCPVTLVDFHADVSSEKVAMGWHLDGRVSAVVGTHTHVPTADARVLPAGTAVVTDLGMVGPVNSVIGVSVEAALHRFVSHMPSRFTVASGPVIFNSVLVTVDATSGKGVAVERIDQLIES